MPIRIIIELDDEAIAGVGFTDGELPYAAASFVELAVAQAVEAKGVADGHVSAIFFVPPPRRRPDPATGRPYAWGRWGRNAEGVYALGADADGGPDAPVIVSPPPRHYDEALADAGDPLEQAKRAAWHERHGERQDVDVEVAASLDGTRVELEGRRSSFTDEELRRLGIEGGS